MRRLNSIWLVATLALSVPAAAGQSSSRKAEKRSSFVRPGENLALGKPYTFSARPNYSYCTDPDDARQLTDGQYTAGYFWAQKGTVGWVHARFVVITLDLGKGEPIRGVSFNTAAGVAGVTWPLAIYVLVSDDGKTFREAGELTELSAKHGLPPRKDYAVHRYWTDAMRAHGRYVQFIVSGLTFVFVDEIEVYRGEPSWLTLPLTGERVSDPRAFVLQRSVHEAVCRRIREDAGAVRGLSTSGPLSATMKQKVSVAMESVEQELSTLPRREGSDFRAVLPLNDLHRRVFQAQAEVWRAAGLPPLLVWQSDLWDPLSHIQIPPHDGPPAVEVAMMRNEYRAAAFNLSNASGKDAVLSLRITRLPGGSNPSYVTVHEVQWTDTQAGTPVAAALPEARREGDAFMIQVPSGLTRQVWLTFHPSDTAPGVYRGQIALSGLETTREIPLALHLSPIRFPDRPTLHLGGWDYTNVASRYEINPQNSTAVIAHLREHFVDSPWASSVVMPPGDYDAQGNMTKSPDTSQFDNWLRKWPNAGQYCVFASVRERFGNARMGTPQFEHRVKAWIQFWADYVKRRGLKPEQLNVLLVDEPHTVQQDEIILAWAKVIRAANTGIRIFEDATHEDPNKANQEMMAVCHVLCPNRPRFLEKAVYRSYFAERRPPDCELAFYSCSGPVRLLDPYSYHRLQAWSCWKYGARGSYYWAFGDSGGASSWNEYAALRNAYVPFFLDSVSVTPGKHMEAVRAGVEDYEYLVMLRNRVAEAEKNGASGPALDHARRLLREAADRVCNAKGTDALRWFDPKDRTVADRVRIEILEVLAQLSS